MIPTEQVKEFLEHVGVKGMKWGVRRNSSSKLTSNSKNKAPSPTKKLSNDQLRQAVDRMRLEQQFKQLSQSANKKKANAGKKFASDLMQDIAKDNIRKVAVWGVSAAGASIATAFVVARNMARG